METQRVDPRSAAGGQTSQPNGLPFPDREEAGRRLATLLERYRFERPFVLALPRGGVPVAYAIAEALNAPLDVLPVRKLGAPGRRELAIGAIAFGGTTVVDEQAMRVLRVLPAQLVRVEAEEQIELERQVRQFRDGRPFPDLHDRTVIVVDDGLATGMTALAATRTVRTMKPRRVVLAVPVCAPEAAEELRASVDDVVCWACPPDFYAVGLWYRDFGPTSDETVIRLLESARQE